MLFPSPQKVQGHFCARRLAGGLSTTILLVNEVVEQWLQVLSVEFRAHVKAVSGRFSVSDVLRAAREMEDLVVHSRDHAYNQIMIFCPQLSVPQF